MMNSKTKQVPMSRLAIAVLRSTHKITRYWPLRRFYFPGYISSWLYAKVSHGFLLLSDYSTAEILLIETLKTHAWNHAAWHHLGCLFSRANQTTQAQRCHIHATRILVYQQQKEDKYTKSSRAFLLQRGIDPFRARDVTDCKEDIHEIDRVLGNLPLDLPRLGNSRIILADPESELERSIYCYLGNPNCINNARSPYLQCAINPMGDCSNCKDFSDIVEE